MPDDDRIAFKLELTVCDRTIEAETPIPNQPLRVVDLLPVLLAFDSALVGMAADKTESDGQKISCREGCGACCRQIVPVAEAEAVYIAELVADLPAPRQAYIRQRFQEALAALGEEFVERLHDTSKCHELAERRRLGEEYFNRGIPCPFLDQERCSIYQHRPMRCREYLVTSPAENCSNPSPETVRPVDVPVQLSRILFCFADGLGDQSTRWLPLVLALEFSGEQKRFPGPELFRRFVSQIGH